MEKGGFLEHGEERGARTPGWLLVLLLGLLAHLPAFGNGYAMDDPWVAASIHPFDRPNPLMTGELPLWRAFTRHYWAETRDESPLYRPATILSFAVVERFLSWGRGHSRARAQHAVNVLLHLLAIWLVLLLLRETGLPGPAVLFGGAWFAVLPAHGEVVASVVGRGDLLAFTAGLGGCLLALRSGGRFPVLLASSFCFLISMLSKETGLVFIPLLPFLFRVLEGKWRIGKAALLGLPPVAAALLLRAQAEGVDLDAPILFLANPLAHVDAWTRIRTAFTVWLHGLALTCGGTSLSSDYGAMVFPLVRTPWSPIFLLSVLLLTGIAVFGVLSFRRRPILFLAAAFFFAFALPVSNLLGPIGTTFGDRLLYPGSLGGALALAWILRLPAWRRRLGLLAVLACLHGAVASWLRSSDWKDDATLFVRDAIAVPRSARLQQAAARIRALEGDEAGNRAFLEAAIRAWPDYATALNRLAAWHLERGNWSEGEALLLRGLASKWKTSKDEFDLSFNLAQVRLHAGDRKGVLAALSRCMEIEPAGFLESVSRIVSWFEKGLRSEDLESLLRRGAAKQPGIPDWRMHLGFLAARRGDPRAAIRELAGLEDLLSGEKRRAVIRTLAACWRGLGRPDKAAALEARLR